MTLIWLSRYSDSDTDSDTSLSNEARVFLFWLTQPVLELGTKYMLLTCSYSIVLLSHLARILHFGSPSQICVKPLGFKHSRLGSLAKSGRT